MDFNFLFLNGYGQFVWPAFIFTFSSCFILYSKTFKKFKKYEKLYLNVNQQNQKDKIEDFDLGKPLSKSPIF